MTPVLFAITIPCYCLVMSGTVFFFHLRPDKAHLYEAVLNPLGVRLVPIYKAGRSSTYTRLANGLQRQHGGVVAGLLEEHPADEKPSWVGLASYSAGYGATREALKEEEHGVQLVVSIDSFYAGEDRDGTASDKDLEGLVRFAKRAREGDGVLWLGHGDVEVHGYASTGQVAEELKRLAGEPQAGYYSQAFNVAQSAGAEHALALTKWGPGFLAEAVKELQVQLADPYEAPCGCTMT